MTRTYTTTRAAALAGALLLATASTASASLAHPSLLAARADTGPWDAVVSASKDLGARLAASASSWRQVMASAAPSRTRGGLGSGEETLAINRDGSLAASLDIEYGASREAAGDVLAEIADWVATLGDVDVTGGPGAGVASAATRAQQFST